MLKLHLREDVGEQTSRGSFTLTFEGPLWVELPVWEEMQRSVSGGAPSIGVTQETCMPTWKS
jgi:hypothetical protein